MQNAGQPIAPMSMNSGGVGAPMQAANIFSPNVAPTHFNGNANANAMLGSMHRNFVPAAVNSSPPRPPFAPVRGVPYDAHAAAINMPEQKTQESLGDLVQEIRSIQDEISTLCDSRGDALVPQTSDLFSRIGHLEERNLLLKQHQEQLLNSSQAAAQAQDNAHEAQQLEALRRTREQEIKIRNLEILLDQAEKKASSMQENEEMLEAQLRTHEQRFIQLEEEAIRIKHSRVVSQVASDEAAMGQLSMAKKEMDEMEARARRREEDFRMLLQEKQLELDRMKTQMSERESVVLKRDADSEQEVTSLVAHVQSLEEANRAVGKEKAELQEQAARCEQEMTSLLARLQLLEETNRTVDQAKGELQQLVANQQEQALRTSEDNANLRATIAEQQDEIARLQYNLGSLNDALQQRDSALRTVDALSEAIGQRDEQLSKLQGDLEIARSAENQGNNTKIAELAAQCEKASSENRFFVDRDAQQRELINHLTKENDNVKDEMRTLQASQARDKNQIAQLEAEIDRLVMKEKDDARELVHCAMDAEVALDDKSNRAAQMARRQSDRERQLTHLIQELQEDKITQEELQRPSQAPNLHHQRSLPESISADKQSTITTDKNRNAASTFVMPKPPVANFSIFTPPRSTSNVTEHSGRSSDLRVSTQASVSDVSRLTTGVDAATWRNSLGTRHASGDFPQLEYGIERGSGRSGDLPKAGSADASMGDSFGDRNASVDASRLESGNVRGSSRSGVFPEQESIDIATGNNGFSNRNSSIDVPRLESGNVRGSSRSGVFPEQESINIATGNNGFSNRNSSIDVPRPESGNERGSSRSGGLPEQESINIATGKNGFSNRNSSIHVPRLESGNERGSSRSGGLPERGKVDTATKNTSFMNPNASVGVSRMGSGNERVSNNSSGQLGRGNGQTKESVSTRGIGSLQNTEDIPEVYLYAFDVIEKFGWDSLRAKDTWTPLHWAAYENRADVCSWLLARGANPHLPDEKGKSALAYAMERSNADAIEILSNGPPAFTA